MARQSFNMYYCIDFDFWFTSGINTAVAPVYLSEIAPIRIRGALGVLNQFGIVTGMLVGYILGLKEVCYSSF